MGIEIAISTAAHVQLFVRPWPSWLADWKQAQRYLPGQLMYS